MSRSPAWLIGLFVLSLCRLAQARERLAVFFTVEGDTELAHNLTDVAIAQLAETQDREFVGMRELESRLGPVLKDRALAACLADAGCLARVGEVAGASSALIGRVHRSGDRFLLDVALTDTETAAARARASRVVPTDTGQLIAAVQSAVADVAAGRAEDAPTTAVVPSPRPRATRPRPAHAGRDVLAPLPRGRRAANQSEPTTSPVTYLAWSAAGLAVISFSAAAATGRLAAADPEGSTREEVQADLERRQDYATLTNGLLVTGGVLLAAAVAGFVWQWQ